MSQMDGFVDEKTEEAADGLITRQVRTANHASPIIYHQLLLLQFQEWRNYFSFAAEEDTGKPETSPACAKVLAALE